jgi:hypothetical protein
MLGMLRRMMNLRASSRLLAAVPVLACVSCQPVSAPKDVDGLSHFFVDNFEVGTDDELADGIVKLNAALKGSTMTDPIKNVIDTKLTLDEVAVIPEQVGKDPKLGQGMFIADVMPCTLDQVEAITLVADQKKQFPDLYDAYQRTFDGDVAAYTARTTHSINWHTEYTTSINLGIGGVTYTADTKAAMRRVPKIDDVKSPFGDVLFTRVYLPAPAKFTQDGSAFDVDYQTEAYYERKPGEVVHFYALWRHMKLGSIATSSDSIFIDTSLDNMVKLDTETAKLCPTILTK